VGRVRKFLSLTAVERNLFLRAWFWLTTIRIMLWVLPFQRLSGLLRRLVPQSHGLAGADQEEALRLARAVTKASDYVPKATCLPQALAVQALLRREGLSADLHIGVAKDEKGEFQAHAWLENRGTIIIGDYELQIYSPFPALNGFISKS
jgi:hypothetical protein